jgi:hypothetical protein
VRYNHHLYKFCCTSSARRSRAAARGQDNVIRQRHTTQGPIALGTDGALILGATNRRLAAPSRPSEEPASRAPRRPRISFRAQRVDCRFLVGVAVRQSRIHLFHGLATARFAGRGVGSTGVFEFDFPILDSRCEREGAANLYSALLGLRSYAAGRSNVGAIRLVSSCCSRLTSR